MYLQKFILLSFLVLVRKNQLWINEACAEGLCVPLRVSLMLSIVKCCGLKTTLQLKIQGKNWLLFTTLWSILLSNSCLVTKYHRVMKLLNSLCITGNRQRELYLLCNDIYWATQNIKIKFIFNSTEYKKLDLLLKIAMKSSKVLQKWAINYALYVWHTSY